MFIIFLFHFLCASRHERKEKIISTVMFNNRYIFFLPKMGNLRKKLLRTAMEMIISCYYCLLIHVKIT